MIFGIGFYSYTIGNMTNLIASMDSKSEQLQEKLAVLKEFKKRTQMPNRLFLKIKRHIENNSKTESHSQQMDKLLNDLPLSLRSQVIACTHGEIIERIHFFKNKQPDFLISIMIELKPLKLQHGDILYHQKDHAEEIYFIQQGKIKLNVDVSQFLVEEEQIISEKDFGIQLPFLLYSVGSYFGDVDVFNESFAGTYRDSTAVSDAESKFFVLQRDSIVKM